MKISLYTITLNGGYYDGPPVPLMEILEKANGWGYDGIELESKRPHGNPMDLDSELRETIRKTAKDNGLDISCIAAYNDFSSPVEEHRECNLLMVREQIKLAADLGSPLVRVFAMWSGVTRRDGRIRYEIARRNMEDRYPGTTPLEHWGYVRDCLAEAAAMAVDHGVTLALQNHTPWIYSYEDMLDFIHEVDSPGLKACLDGFRVDEGRDQDQSYRKAIEDTGALMVHTHFGGIYDRLPDGTVTRIDRREKPTEGNLHAWLKAAKEVVDFQGHVGYELCGPVVLQHKYRGKDYALRQTELAAEYARTVIDSL